MPCQFEARRDSRIKPDAKEKNMNRMRIAWMVLLCLLFAAAAYALPQQDEPKPHEK